MTEIEGNEEKLRAIDYAAGAVAAAGAAGKRVALYTGSVVLGAGLGAYLMASAIDRERKTETSALVQKLESQVPASITPSTLDGIDYLTILRKDGSRTFYQKTTNVQGEFSYTPLSQVYSNDVASARNESAGALNARESALKEKYSSLTNLLGK